MKPAAWRLVATAVLFAGWIGYLGYLVAATRNPIVLSRPQFLISTFDIIATRQGDGSFRVDEVLYPADKNEQWRGKTVEAWVYSTPARREPAPADEGGQYLLPLDLEQSANARVVPTPPSPGYKQGPSPIYAFDAAVLNEYRTVPKLLKP